MMFKEMKSGRVDILWLESNLPCLTRKIRIRLDQSVFILAIWEEGEDPTEPAGVLKGGLRR